ncbi:MAG: hypothetical protein EXQ74_01065 [Thermoleophilia bacterium]|nr:hypothetical protein [Thermoleophilia bacterium]
MTTPPPGPFTFGEIVRHAWRIYRAEPLLFLILTAVTVVPVGVLGAVAGTTATDAGSGSRALAIIAIALIPALLLLPVSGAAVSLATIRRLQGTRIGVGATLEGVGLRFWLLFAALVLVTAGVLAGLVALVIPGIFLAIAWLFVGQAVVIEGKGVTAALRRSHDLVRGSWWTVFLAYLLIQVVTAVAHIILGGVGIAVVRPFDGTAGTVARGIWSTLIQVVVQPFTLIAISLLYADRVIRTDGRLPG